jgi:hypothetical protein
VLCWCRYFPGFLIRGFLPAAGVSGVWHTDREGCLPVPNSTTTPSCFSSLGAVDTLKCCYPVCANPAHIVRRVSLDNRFMDFPHENGNVGWIRDRFHWNWGSNGNGVGFVGSIGRGLVFSASLQWRECCSLGIIFSCGLDSWSVELEQGFVCSPWVQTATGLDSWKMGLQCWE